MSGRDFQPGREKDDLPWSDLPTSMQFLSRLEAGQPGHTSINQFLAVFDFEKYVQKNANEREDSVPVTEEVTRRRLRKKQPSPDLEEFQCETSGCGKSFSDRSKLKRHMLVHTVRLM